MLKLGRYPPKKIQSSDLKWLTDMMLAKQPVGETSSFGNVLSVNVSSRFAVVLGQTRLGA